MSGPRPFDGPCLLFVPGNRPERFSKALRACRNGIVIDLEDGVPDAEKALARLFARQFVEAQAASAPIMVRLNAVDTRAGLDDLSGVADGAFGSAGLVLAKVQSPRDITILRHLDPLRDRPVMAMVETAESVVAAASIAGALRLGDALAFGGADLAAEIGATFAWEPLLAARQALVVAARGRLPIFDVPLLDIAATRELSAETTRARRLGFTGKLAIHPAQVAPIVEAFRPGEAEIARARQIVSQFENGGGAARVGDMMIDDPVYRAACNVVLRHQTTQAVP